MRAALRVLYAEHLALRSVVRVFMLDVKAMAAGSQVNLSDLRDILEYIREFPDRIPIPRRMNTCSRPCAPMPMLN